MPEKQDKNQDEHEVHEIVHHNERDPFRPLWIILAVILGVSLLWILFSYIYLGVTKDNTSPNNNNNQNQTQPDNPEVPTQPAPQNTPTPQTQ